MKALIFCLLFASQADADGVLEIPLISDAPETNQTFSISTFETMAKILSSSRLGPHLDCELKAELRRELRKYSDRSEWIDLIEIEFQTDAGFAGGDTFKVKFPRSSKYGRKKTINHWSGEGEDFKVRAGDYYDHWMRFIHDGKGHIVLFMVGNNLKTYPCVVKY